MDATHMLIAERVYFLGDHAAHVVARDEHRRLERIRKQGLAAVRSLERRRGSRCR